MNPNRALVRFLWTAVIFLAFLGLAVAARRSIVLMKPGALSAAKNPAAQLDAHFANHAALTLAHILPAMLFMVLGPLQFVRSLRSKHPQIHRWSGRIFLTASAVVGVTGLTMAFGKTIGGVDEKAAITLFGTFFLMALAKALWHALRREFAQHREWMIRGYAIGLAVATIRPIMGTFFAAAVLRGHRPDPHEFFDTEFAAHPGLRDRQHDEREWIPVGPEGRSLVPGHHGAHNTHDKAHEAAHQCVLHGPIGCEPRDDVAARHAVDRAICRRKQEGPVEADHRLAPWWEDTDYVQHDVGADGKNDACEHAGQHGADASTNTARRLRFVHDSVAHDPAPFSIPEAPSDATRKRIIRSGGLRRGRAWRLSWPARRRR